MMGAISSLFSGGGSNTVNIDASVDPSVEIDEVTERLAGSLNEMIDTGTVSVGPQEAGMSGGMTGGLEITVGGDNYEDVVLAGEMLLTELEAARQGNAVASAGDAVSDRRRAAQTKSLESLTDLELETGTVESSLVIEPDPAKLMALDLPADKIALLQQELLLLGQGATVATIILEGTSYEIFLEGVLQDITDIETAESLMIGAPVPLPLNSIASVAAREGLTDIRRYDQKVSATITASIGQENIGAVNMAVQSVVDSLSFPVGTEISIGGIMEDMRETFSSMFIAIGIAIGLVYVVLTVTFRSFRNPLIIMMSLPLASIGALLGLLITGSTLGVTGLMGVLMLVGIVLTNAVVLVTVVEQLRKTGMDAREALVRGSQTRLRPILMTALTTMIAMLPIAFGAGEGLIMAADLATVVIGGLFSSTLLTLLVIPVLYAMTHREYRNKS